jgi:hypothetical protein
VLAEIHENRERDRECRNRKQNEVKHTRNMRSKEHEIKWERSKGGKVQE